MKKEKQKEENTIDWIITSIPVAFVIILCLIFFVIPEKSNEILSKIRFFLGAWKLLSYYWLGHFCYINIYCRIKVWKYCSWKTG